MKVSELIAELKKLPTDAEVILQKDAEGNGYSPLYSVDGDAFYVPDSSYSGEVYYSEWTADECCMDKRSWDRMLKQPRCVVLSPVN